MNKLLQDKLWNNIQTFAFDDPASYFPFSKKLAKENNWSDEFAALATEEYRKFIYLCCISPKGASPSGTVDKVWHLHLTFTHNYWISFCKNTLHKDIHHQPSKGGSSEDDKHIGWYKDTLKLYEEVFGVTAPVSIWPKKNMFDENIETAIYKKEFFDKTIITFCLSTLLYIIITHLYKTNGSFFLIYYAALCIAGLLVSLFLNNHKAQTLEKIVSENYPFASNTFEVVHFIYGSQKTYQTALVDLLKRGAIDCIGNDYKFNGYQINDSDEEINPLVKKLAEKITANAVFTYLEGLSLMDNSLLTHSGFEKLKRLSQKVDYQKFIVPGVVLLIGFARLLQGMANNKPVSFLVLEIGLFSLISLMIAQQYSCNNIVFEIAKKIWQTQNEGGQSNNILNNFSILGAVAVAGFAEYPQLANTFNFYLPSNQGNMGGSDGSGCGSSSSGCGGGSSCGGGCGGCGGGD